MLALQMDERRQKVDHLPNQKKDTADALAAVCYHLSHQVNAWQLVGRVKNAGFAATMASPTIGGTITGYSGGSALSEMDRIRLER